MSVSDSWTENVAPDRRWPRLRLVEIWAHHELVYFFALRDVKVRYKQAVLGIGWAVIQPIAGALAFTLVFHELADLEVGQDRGYFVFALVGFVGWTYFSSAMGNGTSSLLANGELLTKVAFPKIVVPTATLFPGLVDLAIGVVLAVVVSLVWGSGLSVAGMVFGLPLGVVLIVLAAAGPGLLLSGAIVKYRDLSILVSFGLQLMLFASPVAYPPETVPESWRVVQYLNPVAGSLSLLRWALSDIDPASPSLIALSFGSAAVIFAAGLVHFRRIEHTLVDVI